MNWCTNWPDGWWRHCCAIHDVAYTLGLDRAQADADLAACVARESWLGLAGVIGLIMWIGVRVFGGRYYRRCRKG